MAAIYRQGNLEVKAGNIKVPTSTAIFNMTPAVRCYAHALGLCQAFGPRGKHVCYAKKAENFRPNVLEYRNRQAAYWQECSAASFARDFAAIQLRKRKPFGALRLNESGDFRGQDDVRKAESIAGQLAKSGVTVYCYTARADLDFCRCLHLKVQGSNWYGRGLQGTFKMIEKETVTSHVLQGHNVCPGDCKICDRCLQNNTGCTVIVRH